MTAFNNFVIIQAIIVCCMVLSVNSQFRVTKSLEFLISSDHNPGDGILFTTDTPTVPAIVRSTTKLCVHGLWALYTSPNYGVSDSCDNVTVYPVRGCTRNDCTVAMDSTLRQIRSFRQLAVPPEAVPKPGNSAEFCSQDNFFGECLTQSFASINTTVKSFAIQSEVMTLRNYMLCNGTEPTDRCVCCRPENGPFLVPRVAGWPLDNPIGNIATIAEVPEYDIRCMEVEQPTG